MKTMRIGGSVVSSSLRSILGFSLLLLLLLLSRTPRTAAFAVKGGRQQRHGGALSVGSSSSSKVRRWTTPRYSAPAAQDSDTASSSSPSLEDAVLRTMRSLVKESDEYADAFGLGSAEAATYCLFRSVRDTPVPLGLRAGGGPFCLRHDAICQALGKEDSGFVGFFTMADLEKAVNDDFLDAKRGSTDNRRGWQVGTKNENSHWIDY